MHLAMLRFARKKIDNEVLFVAGELRPPYNPSQAYLNNDRCFPSRMAGFID